VCSFFTTVASLSQPSASELLIRADVSALLEAMDGVPDPHDPRGVRYPLAIVLGLGVFAACCGAETFDETGEIVADLDHEILAGFGLVRAAPSSATFRRVLNTVDPDCLDEALCVWASGVAIRQDDVPPEPATTLEPAPKTGTIPESQPATAQESKPAHTPPEPGRVISIDGKTLKAARSFDAGGAMSQVAVLEALDHATGAVLAQEQINAGDENAAGIQIVKRLAKRFGSLDGITIVADAKHTTRELASVVTTLGGDWVFTVKGNAPTAQSAAASLPWAGIPIADVTRGKAHGRKETRTLRLTQIPDHIDLTLAGATQAGLVRRTTWRKKTVTSAYAWTHETVLIATSLSTEQASPKRLADILRDHWRVEALHWVRDVVFHEDHHSAHTGHGPRNMAALRNTAITRHRLHGATRLAPTLRAANRHPHRALAAIA